MDRNNFRVLEHEMKRPANGRPTLPTSRKWLEKDGGLDLVNVPCHLVCGEWICWLADGHDGWHVVGDISGRVRGRWYTGGPFVEAK